MSVLMPGKKLFDDDDDDYDNVWPGEDITIQDY